MTLQQSQQISQALELGLMYATTLERMYKANQTDDVRRDIKRIKQGIIAFAATTTKD